MGTKFHLSEIVFTVLLITAVIPYNYYQEKQWQIEVLRAETALLREENSLLELYQQENELLREEIAALRQARLIGRIILHGDRNGNKVAITIDDGWSPALVERALEYLQALQVQATFFPTGAAVENNPDLWRRAVAEGHELGNHTYSHRFITEQSAEQICRELQLWQETVSRVLGYEYPTPFFRPPGMLGFHNGAEESGYYQGIITRRNMITVLWDLETVYTLYNKCGLRLLGNKITPSRVAGYLAGEARGGSIILLHFIPMDIEALPELIKRLRRKGLEPVALSDLLFAGEPVPPGVSTLP